MEARFGEFYLMAHAVTPALTKANASLCALTRGLMKYVSACLEMMKFALCQTLLISLSACFCLYSFSSLDIHGGQFIRYT